MLFILVSSGTFPTLLSYGKTKSKNPYDERRLLEQNKRIQQENNAPEEFPNFIREGLLCTYIIIILHNTIMSDLSSSSSDTVTTAMMLMDQVSRLR